MTLDSRRAAALAGLLAAVGLVVAAKEATGPATPRRVALQTGQVPPSAPSTTVASSPPPSAAATAPPATAPAARQVTGRAFDNPYGTVQVRVTLDGSRLVDVAAVQSPADQDRSVEIAREALPLLRQEVLKAQSAQIDVVSGASYDSQGYAQSVQSALDQARS